MSQDLPVHGFEWRKDKFTFDEDFIQYDADSTSLKLMLLKYPKELHKLHSDLPFLPEKNED